MKLTTWAKRTMGKMIHKALSAVPSSAGWISLIRESYAGEWQTNVTADDTSTLLKFSAIYSCVTGIAGDISKLRIKLCKDVNGIWEEITSNSPFLAVLRKPNHFQNRIQFLEQWIISKLLSGNTYVLLQRDNRGGENAGVVRAQYVLNPTLVTPLVSDSGDVYYELKKDPLSRLEEARAIVPASEIIHDRFNCLWHPLVGVAPLYACALSATMANRIVNSSTGFFANRSMPGGVLSAPGRISDETAARLKATFEANFGGENAGKLAVLGDDLKFQPMQMTAEAAQLTEQLKFAIEDIARAFHYPLFKLGGEMPAYSNGPDAVITMYYTDCLQTLIEAVELCEDEGLALPSGYHTELDLEGLMRMDTAGLYKTISEAVSGGGWLSPNEGRFKANLKPVKGGESPMIQQQNYSLEALAKRDAKEDPFATSKSEQPAPAPENAKTEDEMKAIMAYELRKELAA